MAAGQVYKPGWTPDDIAWDKFEPSKAEPWLVDAIKSAALVEYNAPDYVGYLKRVFPEPAFHPILEQWGREESQHGKVLGRWAEMADPTFKLEEAFERFRAGYRPAHFDGDKLESVRGSRRGEMIARYVVESGTSSYYTAIKEATEEPVLQEIAGRIAADEFRHYRLFYETLKAERESELTFWKKLNIAIGRIGESNDDEIAFSNYCATVPASEEKSHPYDRKTYSRRVFGYTVRVYRRRHIHKIAQMVAKAVGAEPQGWLVKLSSAAVWQLLQLRAEINGISSGSAR
jgi:hypothetical protein